MYLDGSLVFHSLVLASITSAAFSQIVSCYNYTQLAMARLCVSYVMSRVNSQLLKVMSILDEQAKLNPKDADIQLRLELFTDCPDHAPLLNKLEQEYKVINIL